MYNSSTGSSVIFSFVFVCYSGLLYVFSITLCSKWKKVVFLYDWNIIYLHSALYVLMVLLLL